MDRMFDEIARVLATPMSRRETFRRLWKVAAGVALAGAVAMPASAQRGGGCKKNSDCAGGQTCCNSTCIPAGYTCCGTQVCTGNQCCSKKMKTCLPSDSPQC